MADLTDDPFYAFHNAMLDGVKIIETIVDQIDGFRHTMLARGYSEQVAEYVSGEWAIGLIQFLWAGVTNGAKE